MTAGLQRQTRRIDGFARRMGCWEGNVLVRLGYPRCVGRMSLTCAFHTQVMTESNCSLVYSRHRTPNQLPATLTVIQQQSTEFLHRSTSNMPHAHYTLGTLAQTQATDATHYSETPAKALSFHQICYSTFGPTFDPALLTF
jgi:hypothetical protein